MSDNDIGSIRSVHMRLETLSISHVASFVSGVSTEGVWRVQDAVSPPMRHITEVHLMRRETWERNVLQLRHRPSGCITVRQRGHRLDNIYSRRMPQLCR